MTNDDAVPFDAVAFATDERTKPMGAMDDLSKKAQDFIAENKDKIDDALKSEQAENVSDKILGGLAEGVKKITPDEHDAKIDDVRKNLDGKIGNQ